jgi:hypothetical protein
MRHQALNNHFGLGVQLVMDNFDSQQETNGPNGQSETVPLLAHCHLCIAHVVPLRSIQFLGVCLFQSA